MLREYVVQRDKVFFKEWVFHKRPPIRRWSNRNPMTFLAWDSDESELARLARLARHLGGILVEYIRQE